MATPARHTPAFQDNCMVDVPGFGKADGQRLNWGHPDCFIGERPGSWTWESHAAANRARQPLQDGGVAAVPSAYGCTCRM